MAVKNLHLPPKPRLRGWLHEIAFFVSIPAGLALVEHHLGDRFHVRTDLPRIEEEEVDIRLDVELPASVAAQRDERVVPEAAAEVLHPARTVPRGAEIAAKVRGGTEPCGLPSAP